MCTENLITRVEPRLDFEGRMRCMGVDRSGDGRPEEGGDVDGVVAGPGRHVRASKRSCREPAAC